MGPQGQEGVFLDAALEAPLSAVRLSFSWADQAPPTRSTPRAAPRTRNSCFYGRTDSS